MDEGNKNDLTAYALKGVGKHGLTQEWMIT